MAKYIIGIDIGGTKIRGGLWNGKRILRAKEERTRNNREGLARQLQTLVEKLGSGFRVSGIGIGTAGVVKGGKLIFSPNVPAIKNFDFRKLWPETHPRVDNDARCFGRGEYLLGAGRNVKNVLVFSIGTGIGRACGRNGKILKIKNFEYPEKWEKEYQKIRDAKNNFLLAEFLSKNLSKIIKCYKPEVVIIGGGVIERKYFLKILAQKLKIANAKIAFRRAMFDKNAAVIGAALLF